MLIVCPSCASEYTIDPARVGAEGRRVRCAACRQAWFVAREAPPEAVPQEVVLVEEALAEEPAGPPAPTARPELPGAMVDEPIAVAASSGRAEAPPACPAAPARRAPPRFGALLRRLGAPALAALLLAAGITAVAARVGIVSAVPQTARLYAAVGFPVNLRGGLALRDVRAEIAGGEGGALVVEGEIANAGAGEAALPALEITLRTAEGRPLHVWHSEPPRLALEASGSARFRTRLAAPPPEARQVLVRFAGPARDAHGPAAGDGRSAP